MKFPSELFFLSLGNGIRRFHSLWKQRRSYWLGRDIRRYYKRVYPPYKRRYLAKQVRTLLFYTFVITSFLVFLNSRDSIIGKQLRFGNLKIAIVQFANDTYAKKMARPIADVRCYAKRHGYSHILQNASNTTSIHFSKLAAVVKQLRNYDVIAAVDSDVIIGNYSKRIEEYLTPNQDIFLTQSFTSWQISAGMWIVKVTNFSQRWLKEWLSYDLKHSMNHEKGALQMLLVKTLLHPQSRTVRKFERAFNTHDEDDLHVYKRVGIGIRRVLSNPDPDLVTKAASKFKIYSALQSFGRHYKVYREFDPYLSERGFGPSICKDEHTKYFWCKVFGNEIFLQVRENFDLFLPKDLCGWKYRGPAYNEAYLFRSTKSVRELMAEAAEQKSQRGGSEFINHIARCWPNCPDAWNGDDWLWKLNKQ